MPHRVRFPVPGQRAVRPAGPPHNGTGAPNGGDLRELRNNRGGIGPSFTAVTATGRGQRRAPRNDEKRKEESVAQRKSRNVTELRAGHAVSEPTLPLSASPSPPQPGAPRVTARAWRGEHGAGVRGEAGGVRPTSAPRCSSRSALRGPSRAVPPRGAGARTQPGTARRAALAAPQVAAAAPLPARGRSGRRGDGDEAARPGRDGLGGEGVGTHTKAW